MTDTNPSGSPLDDDRADTQDELTRDHATQTGTTHGVAGETVLPGRGDGNDGPTGGAPREPEPEYGENDLAGAQIDLEDTEDPS
ncbi:hypothetical protein [Labedella endophytica]|uniref:Uncharacterized protein n=1 Tax=Labedella endophytica TaxID=1523160 RepID=A0A3S0XNS0_9MICO|nr:hypothetical protein [Labedella endophytica]RUR01618.1 hypothetical protein ELQ94_09060 [Labedella endophytica]